MKRALLAVAAAALALLLCEGLLSFGGRRSLRDLIEERAERWMPAPVAPAAIPASGSPTEPGLYRVHPDPLVGYVLRSNAELDIFDGHIRSDELGLRMRPGPSRGSQALRIAVLGDSVAFGYGLDDDQTLAHRLELLLNASAAGAGATPAGSRPVLCRTVAMPGWNHRNAVHFLLDHMDSIAPDIVLYLPIANDLYDTDGMDETGHRTWIPDPAAADPWLAVCQGPGFHCGDAQNAALRAAGTPELAGASALIADISPESSRRYEENADSIALLDGALQARGAQLVLVQYQEGIYSAHLTCHLHAHGLDLPTLPMFSRVPPELTLGSDPHPAAATVDGMANWIAASLITRGWVAGDVHRLSRVDRAVQVQRAPERPLDEILRGSDTLRKEQRELLRAAVDLQSGEGVNQVYGGVHDDGSIGAHALFVLRRGGPTLRVQLAAIPHRPDLYRLAVDVAVDGHGVGRIELTGAGLAEGTFRLPAAGGSSDGGSSDGGADAPVEVRLAPEHAVVAGPAGHPQLVACRVVRIACE